MRCLGILILGFGFAISAVATGLAQDKHVASGRQLYQSYCTGCHGPEGKGDGVLAKSLHKRPPNLTELLAKNPDGRFQPEPVFKAIEGNGRPASSDMPAWRDTFGKMRETTGSEDVSAKISALVDYLESIQQPAR